VREYTSAAAEGEVNPLAGVFFTLDNERFDCEGELSILELAELARVATAGVDLQEAATLGLIAEQLRQAFGDEVYGRFRQHCRKHKTPNSVLLQILADLNEEMQGIIAEATGRPTQPQSPSGPGEPEQGDRISRVVSMQTGDVQVVRLPEPQDHKPRQDAPSRIKPGTLGGGQPAAKRPRQRRTG
jgi:hypothetical protein